MLRHLETVIHLRHVVARVDDNRRDVRRFVLRHNVNAVPKHTPQKSLARFTLKLNVNENKFHFPIFHLQPNEFIGDFFVGRSIREGGGQFLLQIFGRMRPINGIVQGLRNEKLDEFGREFGGQSLPPIIEINA